MTTPTRRQILGLGLTAGATAVLAPAARTEELLTLDDNATTNRLADESRLRFRVPPDYRPDLSVEMQRRLTRATLDFLLDTHPPDMTLALWGKNPRDLPHLEQHIASTVGAVFSGVEAHLGVRPVDPLLVIALLYNESRFSPVAVSPAGAVGMAQFMPNTALEYDLNPIARPDLWQRYREVRKRERARRRRLQKEFLRQYGISKFSTDEVIRHVLENEELEALAAYQALAGAEKPEVDALQDYVDAVNEELGQFDFFADGEEPLGRLDARASYAAPAAAVAYIAKRLAENSGMTSSAVAAYNAGPASVRDDNPRSVLYGYGDPPAYPETVRYVQRVLVVYSRLREQLA